MSPIEERELIRRTLDGDRDAFGSLYRTHFHRACAVVATRVWDRDEVQDLVQTTFMHAYLGLRGFRGDAAFSTWLTQIALNVCASHLRARQVWRTCLTAVAESGLRDAWTPAQEADPEEALFQKECQALVMRAVEGMPASCQEAVRMRYIEDLSYGEITEVLRTPLGTVKTWLHRGKQRLKEHLDPTNQKNKF